MKNRGGTAVELFVFYMVCSTVASEGAKGAPGGGTKGPDPRPGGLPSSSFSCLHTVPTTLILQIRTQIQSPITAQCLRYAAPRPLNHPWRPVSACWACSDGNPGHHHGAQWQVPTASGTTESSGVPGTAPPAAATVPPIGANAALQAILGVMDPSTLREVFLSALQAPATTTASTAPRRLPPTVQVRIPPSPNLSKRGTQR